MRGSPRAGGGPGDIRALLVDDNERWARLLAEDLEEYDDSLSVAVAVGGSEAMLALREHDRIDCVVADYRMPDVDGLELLDRVRERYPRLPYILVTAEGSEGVASRAIDVGVTDYVIKEPNVDQTTVYAEKIRSAVEQYRLRRALEESEERYRMVTEQSRDAIAIVQDGRLVFGNPALSELVGEDRDRLADASFLRHVVHEDDRERVQETIERWHGGERPGLREMRVVDGDGRIRYCEYTGRSITYGGEQAALVSIRDVTERKQRERELEWERALNRTIQEALVEARTRAELEAAVADQLASHGYSLAWFAEPRNGVLHPRAVEGSSAEYVAEREFTTAPDTGTEEPSVWAVRSGEPRFVGDFESLLETPWQQAALDCGFRSGAALPLVHSDVSYGVLAVYDDDPGRFDETEQGLLENLADTVAFAVHNLERGTALASDHREEATLKLTDPSYYLVEVAQSTAPSGDGASLTVHGTLPHDDDETVQYVSAADESAGRLREALVDHRAVTGAEVVAEAARVRTVTEETPPEATLAAMGAVVRQTAVTGDAAEVTIELAARQDLRSLVETVEEQFGSVSVLSYVELDRSPETPWQPVDTGVLTDKQAAALEAAYHQGYFEQPRASSASEIAESLDVVHSTYLQHLRAAQRKVFGQLYGDTSTG